MTNIADAIQLAANNHAAGNLPQAEICCRQILAVEPRHADALHLLGIIALQTGNVQAAIQHLEQAVAACPTVASYRKNLALILENAGRRPEAVAQFRQALQSTPSDPEIHHALGLLLRAQGQPAEAEAHFRQALHVQPHFADAQYNLANILQERECVEESIDAYRRALELKPDNMSAQYRLAFAFQLQGRFDEAAAQYETALRMAKPTPNANQADYAGALNNLGIVCQELGQLDRADEYFREALRLNAGFADARVNLGLLLRSRTRWTEAVAELRHALRLNPQFAEGHLALGATLHDQGKLEEAIASCRRALELKPTSAKINSLYLCVLQYSEDVTPAGLLTAHREFEQRHGAPRRQVQRPHAQPRDPNRKLRLGFLSPVLSTHAVGFFAIRPLENLDRSQCDVVCYHDGRFQDEMTARFRAVSTWRQVERMSEEQLTAAIRSDQIDVLFDLAGQTSGNRLPVLACKPAPVQITWLDYVGTTGLAAIDYILADRYEIPPEAEAYYSEKVLRMPHDYICYDPPAAAPPVGPLPASRRGHVTFGSFSLPSKVSPRIVKVWAEILRRVARSRLILKYRGLDDPDTIDHIRRMLEAAGGDAGRVEFRGGSPHLELLAHYHDVDVALDTFPYNGGLTACEALWMGVPVITCPGATFAGRHGLTHLSNAGLAETIAADFREYVEMAVRLANDLPKLAKLRAGLREHVAASPLCDGKRFAADLLALLRQVWASRAA